MGGVEAKVISTKKHPDYATGGNYAIHDIAILNLETPIEESNTISYVLLPANGSDPPANSIAAAAGW